MSRLIAIGDIHGCHRELVTILNRIQPEKNDLLVFLGDYVDRGPNTKEVVEELIGLSDKCGTIFIKGNHEEMMESAAFGKDDMRFWLHHGGEQTLDSYQVATYIGYDRHLKNIPWSHKEFFKKLLSYYETDHYIFTHASYIPDLDMDKHNGQILRWTRLDSNSKGPYKEGDSIYVPAPHKSGKKVVVGHSVFDEIFDRGHVIGIDTGCGYEGGKLTALDLTNNVVYSEKYIYQPSFVPGIEEIGGDNV